MNYEYGAMVEWYWQGKTEVLGEKHYTAWVVDEWMSMEQWWNGTDRGNWSTGKKTLYSVGGRWMNGYGAMVEWYWQGKTEVLGENHYTAWVADEWIWSNGGMILTGQNRRTPRKTCASASFSTLNLTWKDLGSNPAFRGKNRRLTASSMTRPTSRLRYIRFFPGS